MYVAMFKDHTSEVVVGIFAAPTKPLGQGSDVAIIPPKTKVYRPISTRAGNATGAGAMLEGVMTRVHVLDVPMMQVHRCAAMFSSHRSDTGPCKYMHIHILHEYISTYICNFNPEKVGFHTGNEVPRRQHHGINFHTVN